MRNKIIAHMYENTNSWLVLADGPIARVETTNGPIALPLKSTMGTFEEITDEMSKHAAVYLWEVKYPIKVSAEHPRKSEQSELMIVRWGGIE